MLEFGAKQAVLITDAATKEDTKERFGSLTIVLTIEEAKGLEFYDVLLLNPLSALSQGYAAIWKVIEPYREYVERGFTDKPPVGDPDPILCSWLKTMYVAVTRARRRVWIIEETAAGKSLIEYWRSRGVIETRREGDAEGAPLQAFAERSTPEEWFQRGHDVLGRGESRNTTGGRRLDPRGIGR